MDERRNMAKANPLGGESGEAELREVVRQKVFERMDLTREMEDEEIRELISQVISEEGQNKLITVRKRILLQEQIYNSLRKLDILEELLENQEITEIMVNGPGNIFYEKRGALYRYEGQFSSEEKMHDIIQQIVGRHNRVVNQTSPIVDTRLADGSRVNVVLSPISIDGSAISIRKFPKDPFTITQLVEIGSLTQEVADFLKLLVMGRYNIFISGGTGSGKTTFLNALSQYIPGDERIITIEDSAELQLQNANNLVRLETRNSNAEGVSAITIRELIRTALRMRPDRIIVGECRGEEALDMLTAMNTGHDGSLSTGHANSCEDMLSRLETMVIMAKDLPMEAIRKQIASGVDIIVQLGRLRDRSRRVLEIVELDGTKNGQIQLNPLYVFKENTKKSTRDRVVGRLVKAEPLKHRQKLMAAGLKAEGLMTEGLMETMIKEE